MEMWRYSVNLGVWWGCGELHSSPCLPMGKSHWYPLDGRLSGPQSWSEHCREEKDTLLLPAIEPKYLNK